MGLRRLFSRRSERKPSPLMGTPSRSRTIKRRLVLESLEARLVLSTSLPLSTSVWTALGPAPIQSGTSAVVNPVSGRINGVAADPNDPNVIYVASAGGGVWKTFNGGTSWNPLTDTQSTLFTGAIAVAPSNSNVIYAGTGEANNGPTSFYGRGILKSTNAGGAWTLLTDFGAFDRATISKIVVNPTDPNTVYAAVAGAGINGSPTVATGIYRSNDGGVNWVNTTQGISTTDAYTDVVINPANPLNMYMAVGTATGSIANGVYVSNDAGVSWQLAGNFPSGTADGRIALTIATGFSPATLYASIADPGTFAFKSIQKSVDGGSTWTVPYTTAPANYLGNAGNYDTYIAVDPANRNTVFAAGALASSNATSGAALNSIIESTDGGVTWRDITTDLTGIAPHIGHHAYAFNKAGKLIDVNDGGIWILTNPVPTALQWTNLNGNLAISELNGIALVPNNPNLAYAGTQGNGTQRFSDSTTWTLLQGGDGGGVLVDPTRPTTLYRSTFFKPLSAANVSFFQRSLDGGATWTNQTAGITTATDLGGAYAPFVIDPTNSSRLLIGTDHVYESINQGLTWTPISLPKTGPNPFSGWNSNAAVTALAISVSDPTTIYASTADGKIFVSNSDGSTWSERDVTVGGRLIDGTFGQVLIDPSNRDVAYVVRSSFNSVDILGNPLNGHVFKTTDGGRTWSDLSGNLPDLPTWSIAVDTRPGTARMYVGNDNGVYSSSDQGVTWSPYKSGLPNAQVKTLVLDPTTNILAAGTHGRGLFEVQISQTIDVQIIAPQNIVEGSILADVPIAQFTDLVAPGAQGEYTATINWGDGHITQVAKLTPTSTPGTFLVSGSNTYAKQGSYTISVTVQHSNGDSGQNSLAVVVNNAPVTSPANFTINSIEGRNFSGVVTTFQDANANDLATDFTATIDWGNNNVTQGQVVANEAGNGLFNVVGTNFYTTLGMYPVTVVISDTGVTAVTAHGTALVADAPLTATAKTFNAVEGTAVTAQVASFTDANLLGVLSSYTANIDWGDGKANTQGVISAAGGGFVVTGTHTYSGFGKYTVTVTIGDKGTSTAVVSSTANIGDAPLTPTGTALTVAKGQPLPATTVVANFVDTNTLATINDFAATTIDWGDGTNPTAATIVRTAPGQFSVQGGHTYQDPGSFTINVLITDFGGSSATAQSKALVGDIPVVGTGVVVTGPLGEPAVEGTSIDNALVATFTDPFHGALNYYKATIDWGDHLAPSPGSLSFDPFVSVQYDVSGTHTYRVAGNYTILVTVTDGGGASSTITSTVSVANAPLELRITPPTSFFEGVAFNGPIATFTDGNPLSTPADFVATVDWGNGNVTNGQIVNAPGGGFNINSTNTYAAASAPGQFSTIMVTLTDQHGTQPIQKAASVKVEDAPITARPTTQAQAAIEGNPFNGVIATFVDANPQGPLADYTATIDWGDGHITTGTISPLGGGVFNVSGTNTYLVPRSFTAQVTFGDTGGSSDISTTVVNVADAPLSPLNTDGIGVFPGTAFSGRVLTFQDGNPLAGAGDFTASINWGDGHTTRGTLVSLGNGQFQVNGTNTYASKGDFPITVSIKDSGGASLDQVVTAHVLAPLVGTTGNGGATNNPQPTFSGTAEPGTTVRLTVSPSGSPNTAISLGDSTVDSSGKWSITSGRTLDDGTYTATASLVSGTGTPLATLNLGTISIDRVAPTVSSVVFNARTRQLRVTLKDNNSGFDAAALGTAANYSVGLVTPRGVRKLTPSGLSSEPGANPGEVIETISYKFGRRPSAGNYVVTLSAAGLSDRAGNHLLETKFVKYPQTTNTPDPDYIAQIHVNRRLGSTGPQTYIPAAARFAAARFARRVHGRRGR
jgi:hypothetical protein